MDAPPRLMRKQAEALFANPAERDRFVRCLMEPGGREQAIIVLRNEAEVASALPQVGRTTWQPEFVRRVPDEQRPGRHHLHDQGDYYVLDYSSVFAATPLLEIDEPTPYVLDLCAAPGGKAIFGYRALRPERIVANETIRKRTTALISNLFRCKIEGSSVWSADPSIWAERHPETFDLVIVDAPCTGQSLLAKGMEAPGCFSPQMIDLNVGRQRRIVGNAARCVRPGGWLLYSTCTFSRKENEKVVEWLVAQAGTRRGDESPFPEFHPVEVPRLTEFRSVHSPLASYRLFPHQGLGAGAFTCLLRRAGPTPIHRPALEVQASWTYSEADPPEP